MGWRRHEDTERVDCRTKRCMSETIEHRCTGQCCTIFQIYGMTLDELKAKFPEKDRSADNQAVIDMLVALSPEEQQRRHEATPTVPRPGWVYNPATPFFTCRHFDEATRNCLIYETRPAMCRDYPYGKQCGFVGCTFVQKKIEVPDDARKAEESITK